MRRARLSKPFLLTTLLVPLALVAAACGGAASSSAPSNGTTAPTAAPASETPASAAPTTGGEASAEPSMAVAIPSFDLSKLGGAIPGVDSYRVAFTVDGVKQYESVVVTQPKLAKHITTFEDDGDVDDEFIVIGDQAWTKDDGAWQSMPSQLISAMLFAFDPATMFAAYATTNWTGAASDRGSEDKNGIPSHHFSIDPTFLVGADLPAGTTVDLWVADAGHLTALEVVSNGVIKLGVEVSNVNDPANVVEAPTS